MYCKLFYICHRLTAILIIEALSASIICQKPKAKNLMTRWSRWDRRFRRNLSRQWKDQSKS